MLKAWSVSRWGVVSDVVHEVHADDRLQIRVWECPWRHSSVVPKHRRKRVLQSAHGIPSCRLLLRTRLFITFWPLESRNTKDWNVSEMDIVYTCGTGWWKYDGLNCVGSEVQSTNRWPHRRSHRPIRTHLHRHDPGCHLLQKTKKPLLRHHSNLLYNF